MLPGDSLLFFLSLLVYKCDFPEVCIRVGDSWDFWAFALFLSPTVMPCPVPRHSSSLSKSCSTGRPLGRHKRKGRVMDETELLSYLSFSRMQAVCSNGISHSYCCVRSLGGRTLCNSGCTAPIAKKSLNVVRAVTTNPNGSSSGLGSR